MPTESRTEPFAHPIDSFWNAGNAECILSPGEFDGFAAFDPVYIEHSIHARGMVGSEQQQFHGYGVPETCTSCSALYDPFFNS